jgi:X-X-X-Leu-X-X-Gly heptad repeat protein
LCHDGPRLRTAIGMQTNSKTLSLFAYRNLLQGLGVHHESLADGLESLVDGLESVVGGLESLADGLESLVDGLESLADGLESLVDGLESLVDGLESLADGLESLVLWSMMSTWSHLLMVHVNKLGGGIKGVCQGEE